MNTPLRTMLMTAILTAILVSISPAQTTYNDVLVLSNSSSPISTQVASYFRAQRGIPAVNMCAFAMPTTDEIDSLEFATIAATIKNYLVANNLTNAIQYIVTTQGVPLKVRRSSSVFSVNSNAASFDSELTLLQSGLEPLIGQNGSRSNPYFGKTVAFSRAANGSIRLVTRLAGYDYTDIAALIDRATQPYMSNGTVYLDWDPTKTYNFYYSLLVPMMAARDTLRARGFSVSFDSTEAYITNKTSALGYMSFGSNDAYWTTSGSWKARPNFTWSAKALVETFVSSSGRTFSDSSFVEPTIGWQSMTADLIHEGVTGVKGYVYEPYAGSMAKAHHLYGNWTNGRNLAESFYSASANLSWMDVVIGDPKATLAGNGHLPVELVAFSGLYRNNTITLNWKTATETNNYGFNVERRSSDGSWNALGFVSGNGTTSSARFYSFQDERPAASNVYRLRQIDRDGTEHISQSIEVAGADPSFTLLQNYPNPFNPSTTLAFNCEQASTVTLAIYAIDGRLVRTLASQDAREAGTHAYFWDGNDDSGNQVASGLYLYRLTAAHGGSSIFTASRTMTLVR